MRLLIITVLNAGQAFYEKRPISDGSIYQDTYTLPDYEIPEYKRYFTVLYYPRKITKTSWSSDINNPDILSEKGESKETKFTFFTYEEYTTKYNLGTLSTTSAPNVRFPSLFCGKTLDAVLSKASTKYRFPYSRANTYVTYENTDRRLVHVNEPTKYIDIDYQYYQEPYIIHPVTPIFCDPIAAKGITDVNNIYTQERVWKSVNNAVSHYSITDKYSYKKIRSIGYSSSAYMDMLHDQHSITIADTINILSLDNNNEIVIGVSQ